MMCVVVRAKESGRLWVYDADLWDHYLRGKSQVEFEEVVRSDDIKALKQMQKLANHEINDGLEDE